jgi:hypothetical protein
MKSGPLARVDGGKKSAHFTIKAAAAHGEQLPDWIGELARICDRDGLRETARRVGYSAAALSYVIAGTYGGDLARVEQAVRGAVMGESVDCPVLGETPRHICLAWQKKPFAATSSLRVRVFRACRAGCAHAHGNVSSSVEGGDDND